MILGYALISQSGIPVIIESFVENAMSEDMESLFSAAMSALNTILSQTVRTPVSKVELGDQRVVYFKHGEFYTFMIIADQEDVSAESISRNVADMLEKYETGNIENIINDPRERKRLARKIREIVIETPPDIQYVKRAAELINGYLRVYYPDAPKIGIKKLKPKELNINRQPVRGLSPSDEPLKLLKEILRDFSEMKLEDVLKKTLKLFDIREFRVVAQTLWCKAAVILNTLQHDIKAPPLGECLSVIDSIEDEFLREYFMENITDLSILEIIMSQESLLYQKENIY